MSGNTLHRFEEIDGNEFWISSKEWNADNAGLADKLLGYPLSIIPPTSLQQDLQMIHYQNFNQLGTGQINS